MVFLQILVSVITDVLTAYIVNITLRYYVYCEVIVCLNFVHVVHCESKNKALQYCP